MMININIKEYLSSVISTYKFAYFCNFSSFSHISVEEHASFVRLSVLKTTVHGLSLLTFQNYSVRRLFTFSLLTLSSYHGPVTYDKRLLTHQCDIETLIHCTGK